MPNIPHTNNRITVGPLGLFAHNIPNRVVNTISMHDRYDFNA